MVSNYHQLFQGQYLTLIKSSSFCPVHMCSPACRLLFWPMSWIIFLSCQFCCCCCIDFHTALKGFCFLHLLHFLPYAGHGQELPCTTVLASIFSFVHFEHSMILLGVFYLTMSMSLASFMSLGDDFCIHCTSISCVHNITYSPVVSSKCSNVATSIIPSPISLLMNYSVSNLSHFVLILMNLLIHSLVDS